MPRKRKSLAKRVSSAWQRAAKAWRARLASIVWWVRPLSRFNASWDNAQRGLWGEKAAALHLYRQGMAILEHRWRFGRTDIDLIATDDVKLVFVEVKLRSPGDPDPWGEIMDRQRIARQAAAASAYLKATRQRRVPVEFWAVLVQPPSAEAPRHPVIEVEKDYINPQALRGASRLSTTRG